MTRKEPEKNYQKIRKKSKQQNGNKYITTVPMKEYKVVGWEENLCTVYKRVTSQLKHSLKGNKKYT